MDNAAGDPLAGAGPAKPKNAGKGRGAMWAFLLILLAFGGGFGWQYMEVLRVQEELEQTAAELRIERLRVDLARAAMAAQFGDFEAARQQMSGLFTRLQDEVATLPPELAGMANEMLAQRDDVITGLSRSNPAYAGLLYDFLRRFRTAADMGAMQAPVEPAAEGMDETPMMEDSVGGG